MFSPFPYYQQHDTMDCGATCLRMVARYYGKSYSAEQLQELCTISHEGVSLLSINDAAQELGFRTVSGRITLQKLITQKPLPCILYWNQEHFVVLYAIQKKWNKKLIFHIADPGKGLLTTDEETFKDNWLSTRNDYEEKGILLVLQPTPQFYDKEDEKKKKKSSFKFLYGYLHQYKRFFFQLALGLLLGSILQLLFPFLTQAIVDIGIADKNIGFIYLILVGQLVFNIKSLKLQQIQESGAIFINQVKNIIITIVAATTVVKGELSLDMMLAIQYIIGQLNSPVERFHISK